MPHACRDTRLALQCLEGGAYEASHALLSLNLCNSASKADVV
jgi:hypothetical protein